MTDGLIRKEIGGANRRLLGVNTLMLAGVWAIGTYCYNPKYAHSFLYGPIPLAQEKFAADGSPTSNDEYFSFRADDLVDSGLSLTVKHDNETRRIDFLVARVATEQGVRPMLVRVPAGHDVGLLGQPLELQTAFMGKSAEMDRLPPDLLPTAITVVDRTEFDLLGYLWLAVVISVTSVAIWNIAKALRRMLDPESHPIFRSLGRGGSAADFAAEIDREANGPVPHVGALRFTPNWLLRWRWFGLIAIRYPDLIWAHAVTTRHFHGGIPAGKTHALALHDRYGKSHQIKTGRHELEACLEAIKLKAPWTIVGFSKDVERNWRRNRQGLIDSVDARRQQNREGDGPEFLCDAVQTLWGLAARAALGNGIQKRPGCSVMSYYTHVEFAFSDDPPAVDAVLTAARKHLEAQNLYAVDAVLADLRTAWEKGSTDFNGLVSDDVESLMKSVSAVFRNLRFIVRGTGEEMRDLWVRELEAGQLIYGVGPFDSE